MSVAYITMLHVFFNDCVYIGPLWFKELFCSSDKGHKNMVQVHIYIPVR